MTIPLQAYAWSLHCSYFTLSKVSICSITDSLSLEPLSSCRQALENEHDPGYNWNSCRVPWRLGHYYMLSKDQRLRQLLETKANFFARQLARGEIKAGYHLDGKPFVDYSDMTINALVSFLFWVLDRHQELQQVIKYMRDHKGAYFGETITMLGFLQAHVPY